MIGAYPFALTGITPQTNSNRRDVEEREMRYRVLERRILDLALESGIPQEEVRDWYMEVVLGRMTVEEFSRAIGRRISDPHLKRRLEGMRASIPSAT